MPVTDKPMTNAELVAELTWRAKAIDTVAYEHSSGPLGDMVMDEFLLMIAERIGQQEPQWLGKPVAPFGDMWVAQTQPNGKRVVFLAKADVTFKEFCTLGSDGQMETLPFDGADNHAYAETFWPKHPDDK